MAREKRAHARVAIPVTARIRLAGRTLDYAVRDVSLGGAFLFTPEPPGPVGTVLAVELALTAGIKPLALQAELVRIVLKPKEHGGGILGIGLQFKRLPPEHKEALLDLIDRGMRGPGTHPRAFPRVQYLIDVVCRTKVELRALLKDIGEGGVGLMLDREVPLHESLTIELARPGQAALKLEGFVVRVDPVEGVAGRFHVGVRFKRIGDLRQELHKYLRQLYSGPAS